MSNPVNQNRPIGGNVQVVDRGTRDPLLRIRLPNSLKRQREVEAQSESSRKTQAVSQRTLAFPSSSSPSQLNTSKESVSWGALLQVTGRELAELSANSQPHPQIEHPFNQPSERNWIFRAYHPFTPSSSSTSNLPSEPQDWIFEAYNPSDDDIKKSPEPLRRDRIAIADILHPDTAREIPLLHPEFDIENYEIPTREDLNYFQQVVDRANYGLIREVGLENAQAALKNYASYSEILEGFDVENYKPLSRKEISYYRSILNSSIDVNEVSHAKNIMTNHAIFERILDKYENEIIRPPNAFVLGDAMKTLANEKSTEESKKYARDILRRHAIQPALDRRMNRRANANKSTQTL